MAKKYPYTKTQRKHMPQVSITSEPKKIKVKTQKQPITYKEKIFDEGDVRERAFEAFLVEYLKDSPGYLPDNGMGYISNKKTLCNKIREIYIATDDDEIKKLCEEATVMAKKMSKRLQEYYNSRI